MNTKLQYFPYENYIFCSDGTVQTSKGKTLQIAQDKFGGCYVKLAVKMTETDIEKIIVRATENVDKCVAKVRNCTWKIENLKEKGYKNVSALKTLEDAKKAAEEKLVRANLRLQKALTKKTGNTTIKKVYVAKTLYSLAFGTYDSTYFVYFKDGNKQNCVLDNLYLIERKEYYKLKGYSSTRRKALTIEQCAQIRADYNNTDRHFKSQWGKDGKSIRDLAKEYHVAPYTIQQVLAGNYDK